MFLQSQEKQNIAATFKCESVLWETVDRNFKYQTWLKGFISWCQIKQMIRRSLECGEKTALK